MNSSFENAQIRQLEYEIERLKFLNSEERQTIDELGKLCLRAADALETARQGGSVKTLFYSKLIAELRKAAQ